MYHTISLYNGLFLRQERKHIKFRHLCRSFFMEVISTLCFERNMLLPPEPDLIMMLMNIVFAEGNATKVLSPFNNEITDTAPVIRSNLLQLLLEFRYSICKLFPLL